MEEKNMGFFKDEILYDDPNRKKFRYLDKKVMSEEDRRIYEQFYLSLNLCYDVVDMSLIKSLINKYGGSREERYFTAIGELEKVTGAITNGGKGEYYEELNKSKNFVGLNEVVKEYFKDTEYCQQQSDSYLYARPLLWKLHRTIEYSSRWHRDRFFMKEDHMLGRATIENYKAHKQKYDNLSKFGKFFAQLTGKKKKLMQEYKEAYKYSYEPEEIESVGRGR